MAAYRLLLLIVVMTMTSAALGVVASRAQSTAPVAVPQTQNPAEGRAYAAAMETRDPAKRAQALEIFIAWYPNSTLRISAHEELMSAWQAASSPAKADAVAVKLLQIEPDNLRALANRVYVARTRAAGGDASALPPAIAAAERGLALLPRLQRPEDIDERSFLRLKLQFAAVFNGLLGFAALQQKDYARARRLLGDAVLVDPDNLQDVYQLSVAQLESTPVDALGFWYGARAIAITRAAKNEPAAAGIDKYVRARYKIYRGSEEGFDAILTRASSERLPPDNFVRAIPRLLTPDEKAIQLVTDNDPGALSYADWGLVLSRRDSSPANKTAAERVWKAISDKQRGGGARLKIPIKVLASGPDRIEGAITDENQANSVVDLDVKFVRPLSPMPAVGTQISVIGTLTDYRVGPFAFVMTNAELAPESLPVAGGACAEPRPQACTMDYRPACGLRRDNSRKTYGNACSACADGQVVSQSAGACP